MLTGIIVLRFENMSDLARLRGKKTAQCTHCAVRRKEKNHPLTNQVTGGLTLFHKLEWCGPSRFGCVRS